MEVVRVTTNDLSLFRACQEEERLDWDATFSVEPNGEIYPFITRSLTPLECRVYLRNKSAKLAEIADIYLQVRPSGGRFFIDRRGAYFHEIERGPFKQFIEFSVNDITYVPPLKKTR